MRNRVFRFPVKWSALALTAAALVLAAPAPASAASFTAHLSAPNHTPVAGKKWPITVTATHGRSKLSGSVHYQFLFDGSVVSTQPGHSFSRGVFHDSLLFPKEAVGHSLTLRVIVKTRYGTVNLDWSVKTKA